MGLCVWVGVRVCAYVHEFMCIWVHAYISDMYVYVSSCPKPALALLLPTLLQAAGPLAPAQGRAQQGAPPALRCCRVHLQQLV